MSAHPAAVPPTPVVLGALEIIAPGGFERYFAELAPMLPPQAAKLDPEAVLGVQTRYGLTMDLTSAARLTAEHGLVEPRA